eukprot:Awhi_evm1s7955
MNDIELNVIDSYTFSDATTHSESVVNFTDTLSYIDLFIARSSNFILSTRDYMFLRNQLKGINEYTSDVLLHVGRDNLQSEDDCVTFPFLSLPLVASSSVFNSLLKSQIFTSSQTQKQISYNSTQNIKNSALSLKDCNYDNNIQNHQHLDNEKSQPKIRIRFSIDITLMALLFLWTGQFLFKELTFREYNELLEFGLHYRILELQKIAGSNLLQLPNLFQIYEKHHFHDLPPKVFIYLLKQDELIHMSELELFIYSLRMIEYQLNHGIIENEKEKMILISEYSKYIRFSLIPPRPFYIQASQFLTEEVLLQYLVKTFSSSSRTVQ